MNTTARLLKALELSSYRHRKQIRKGSENNPYIMHPIQVASLLANTGNEHDEVLLIGAVLHDTIEDTVANEAEKNELMQQIESEFGTEVLDLVLEVTDDKSLEKQERKRLQIEHAPHKSVRAKKLKIADKISNIQDIILAPQLDWSIERRIEYLHWANNVVAGLRGVNPVLEKMFDDLFQDGLKILK